MSRREDKSASKQLRLPVLAASAVLMLGLPSASLALAGLNFENPENEALSLDLFTPASVDPELAARVADKARERGLRFTPAGANPALRDGTVTVAVRIDDEAAKVISVRNVATALPGLGTGESTIKAVRFDLGTARGYQSFARPVITPEIVRDLSVPDLSEFEPAVPTASDRPSRLKPRIELENTRISGRSINTREYLGPQTVDLGGSFRISSKVDVTAGVRLSQERERLRPLTNSVQDSQSVYVGTQIKF